MFCKKVKNDIRNTPVPSVNAGGVRQSSGATPSGQHSKAKSWRQGCLLHSAHSGRGRYGAAQGQALAKVPWARQHHESDDANNL